MSIHRSYFEKNTTLILDSKANTAKNEVFELIFGKHPNTDIRVYTRYIFKVDFTGLQEKINNGYITENMIGSHTLRFYNCIVSRPELIGDKFYDGITDRVSDFNLLLFEVPEDWSEGTGYEFAYSTRLLTKTNTTPSNWYYRKQPDVAWSEEGIYSGTPINILSTIHFDRGNENIEVDITNYVNGILFSGNTSYGLGLAFAPEWELKDVTKRYGVSFFSKYTSTYFEPHVESYFNDKITDDRNEFYLDKTNNLFLYSYVGGELVDLDNTPTEVEILDEENDLYATITDISRVKKGHYKISFSLSSSEHNDMVKYHDIWKGLSYQGIPIGDVMNSFILLPKENYYHLNDSEQMNRNDILFLPNNFYVQYNGILESEKITRGDSRRVIVDVRNKMYQDSLIYLDNIEYRIYIKQGKTEIEVIPFTKLNKSDKFFFFDIDTSWFIPNHYYIQVRLKRNNLVDTRKEILKFIIQNELK